MEWKWSTVDEGRAARAKKVELSKVSTDENCCQAFAAGSSGEVYNVTLETCTCRDFALQHGKQPCKHIVRLAMEAGVLDSKGRTKQERIKANIRETKEQIARCTGYYYVFHESLISDKAYDALKEKLKYLQGESKDARCLDELYTEWIIDLANKVALAAGYYYAFKQPIIKDEEYNSLKFELWDNSPIVPPEYETESDDYPFPKVRSEFIDMSFPEFLKYCINKNMRFFQEPEE